MVQLFLGAGEENGALCKLLQEFTSISLWYETYFTITLVHVVHMLKLTETKVTGKQS